MMANLRTWALACTVFTGLLPSAITAAHAQAVSDAGLADEEILVTASKRVESIQDVPSSISALSGEQLQSLAATQLADFATYVPGFALSSGGSPGQTLLTLRGISSGNGSSALVGTYIDDNPLGSSSNYARAGSFALDLLPYDIERVEVLRGPQGTLYGASTMGGLLKYVTRRPDLRDVELRAGGDLSWTESAASPSWGLRAGLNSPLIDGKLAFRTSVYHQKTAGYIDDLGRNLRNTNDATQTGGRLAVLWRPAEVFEVEATAMFQDLEADNNAVVTVAGATQRPVGAAYTRSSQLAEGFDQKLRFYSLTGRVDLGWAELLSTSSLSRTTTDQLRDASNDLGALFPLLSGGAIPAGLATFDLDVNVKKFTQEVRLTSEAGEKFEWMVGAFYTDENVLNLQRGQALTLAGAPIAALNPLFDVFWPSYYNEYAVFANSTLRFSDSFDVTAGLRWAENKQSFDQVLEGPLTGFGTKVGRSKDDVITYMVSPRLHLGDDTMIYVRVASGYRPGGPNVALPGIPTQVGADKLTNYEAGFKTELLDRRALINLSAFYIDWTDIQITIANDQNVSYGANGGEATSKGFELTTSFAVTEAFRLGANVAYTDATLSQDVPALGGKEGDRLPLSPRWNAALTADYDAPLTGDWRLSLGGGLRHRGSVYSALEGDPRAVRLKPYEVIDLYAAVTDGLLTGRIFVKNAGGREAYSTVYGTNRQLDLVTIQPRTIGVALDVKF